MRRDLKWKLKEHNHQAHVIPVKTRKKLDVRIDYDDDFDSGPTRVSMSGVVQVGYDRKGTGGYGGVASYRLLDRILMKHVGQPFDVIYSRLCSQFPARSKFRQDLDRNMEHRRTSKFGGSPEFYKDENGLLAGAPWWTYTGFRLTKAEKRARKDWGKIPTIQIDELHAYVLEKEYYSPAAKLWSRWGHWRQCNQESRPVWRHITYEKHTSLPRQERADGLHQALLNAVRPEPKTILIPHKTREIDHKEMNWIKEYLNDLHSRTTS